MIEKGHLTNDSDEDSFGKDDMEPETTECKLLALRNKKPPIFHGEWPALTKCWASCNPEYFTNIFETTRELHRYGRDYYFIGALTCKYVL